MTKEPRIFSGEKEASSVSDAGEKLDIHRQKHETRPCLILVTKINLKWTKDLTVRIEAIKLLIEKQKTLLVRTVALPDSPLWNYSKNLSIKRPRLELCL